MRILHVFDHSIPLHSGYTFRSRAILEQQRAMGWETFHITSAKHKGSDTLEEEIEGLRFFRTPEQTGWLAKLPILSQFGVIDGLAKRLAEVVDEIHPDILHAHSPALNGMAALRVAQWQKIPVVYECRAFWEDAAVDHGTCKEGSLRYRLTHALETAVFRRAQAVTTICEGLREDILSRGIPAGKVTVIPNAVDIKRFVFGRSADPVLRAELGLAGKTVLGFIGSFYAYEGLSLLLDALPAMLARRADLQLLLIGGGPQEAELKAQSQRLGLDQHVFFSGRVPHDQVQRYYDQVDLFVYPRIAMRLTDLVTPLKPLEAMAQGRLVIASDVGGHRELIRNGETGRLFRAGDIADLADTVLDMLAAPESWDGFRQRGRAFVERERNWPASVARYREAYGAALGRDLTR